MRKVLTLLVICLIVLKGLDAQELNATVEAQQKRIEEKARHNLLVFFKKIKKEVL